MNRLFMFASGLGLAALIAFFLVPAAAPVVAQGAGCANVAGAWQINSTIDHNTCDEEIDPIALVGEMKQDGCKVELDIGVGLDGEVRGNRVYLKGEYWWMGTTTKDIELVVTGNTFTGKGKWTYSFLGYSCDGTEVFKGSKKS